MLNKGLGTYTAVLIIVTVFLLSFALLVLSYGSDLFRKSADESSCLQKLTDYCSEWYKKDFTDDGKPYNWEEKDPTGCDKVKIYEPTADQCRSLAGLGSP